MGQETERRLRYGGRSEEREKQSAPFALNLGESDGKEKESQKGQAEVPEKTNETNGKAKDKTYSAATSACENQQDKGAGPPH